MNYAALRSESLTGPRAAECAPYVILPTDPKVSGAVAAQQDAAIAAILNESHPTELAYRPVSVADAMIWAASGPMAGIAAAAANPAHPAHASCLVVQLLFQGDPKQPIEFGKPEVRAMFDGWLAAGVIDADQHAELIEIASRTASYAEAVGLAAVTGADVSNALRGGTGVEVPNR